MVAGALVRKLLDYLGIQLPVAAAFGAIALIVVALSVFGRSLGLDFSDSEPSGPAMPAMPADEAGFIEAIRSGRRDYSEAINNIVAKASRPIRATALCGELPSGHLAGWLGRVAEIDSSMTGKGIFAVDIAPDLRVSTWNNGVSDLEDETMIQTDGSLFSTIASLHKGDQVRLDGDFIRDPQDCFMVQNITLDGVMTTPSFVVRFAAVSPAAG